MKKVLSELREFTTDNANVRFLLFQGVILAVLIYGNYALGLDDWADSYSQTYKHFLVHFAIYFVPYFFTLLVYCLLVEKSLARINASTLAVSMLAMAILSFNEYFYFHKLFISNVYPDYVGYLIQRCLNNLASFLTYFLPILFYWWAKHRKQQPLYGFSAKTFSPKLYFQLLLIMVPIVAIASFQEGFTNYYPSYKDYGTAEHFGLPEWVGVVVFEICYGLDFVSTEVYFRGFLILGMLELLGPASVFSMVTVYCVIHFGKPMGECISSIFGGYILGVITWYTRSIYGGIIIHLGIAWLMEVFAFWQKM